MTTSTQLYQIKPATLDDGTPTFWVFDTHGRALGRFPSRYAATTYVVDLCEEDVIALSRPRPASPFLVVAAGWFIVIMALVLA